MIRVQATINLVKARFSWDDGGEDAPIFDGWHDPSRRWNGWACPYFERAEADRIAAFNTGRSRGEDYAPITYDAVADAYVVDERASSDDPAMAEAQARAEGYIHNVEAVVLDGRRLYPIGAWAWTWSEFDEAEAPRAFSAAYSPPPPIRESPTTTIREWGREHGSHLRWRAALDNHEPVRDHAQGEAYEFDNDVVKDGIILLDTTALQEPRKATYLVDDGGSVRAYYVASWQEGEPHLVLHPFPLNIGTRPDNGQPVDMSTWMVGPRRAYHLKVTR